MMTRGELLEHLEKNTKVLKNPRIKAAFEAIDRADFVSEELKDEAYEDYPLPIGHDQTISQPTTVAFMLELLDPQPGQKILDIGSGSGWATALLGHIVGEAGSVLGLEVIPELAEEGQGNLKTAGVLNARIEPAAPGVLGKPEVEPLDRILVSAAASEIPEVLVQQLSVGGILVVPVGDALVRVLRESEEGSLIESHEGFAFVPLVN